MCWDLEGQIVEEEKGKDTSVGTKTPRKGRVVSEYAVKRLLF